MITDNTTDLTRVFDDMDSLLSTHLDGNAQTVIRTKFLKVRILVENCVLRYNSNEALLLQKLKRECQNRTVSTALLKSLPTQVRTKRSRAKKAA